MSELIWRVMAVRIDAQEINAECVLSDHGGRLFDSDRQSVVGFTFRLRIQRPNEQFEGPILELTRIIEEEAAAIPFPRRKEEGDESKRA